VSKRVFYGVVDTIGHYYGGQTNPGSFQGNVAVLFESLEESMEGKTTWAEWIAQAMRERLLLDTSAGNCIIWRIFGDGWDKKKLNLITYYLTLRSSYSIWIHHDFRGISAGSTGKLKIPRNSILTHHFFL
jgi:hypothetical protein